MNCKQHASFCLSPAPCSALLLSSTIAKIAMPAAQAALQVPPPPHHPGQQRWRQQETTTKQPKRRRSLSIAVPYVGWPVPWREPQPSETSLSSITATKPNNKIRRQLDRSAKHSIWHYYTCHTEPLYFRCNRNPGPNQNSFAAGPLSPGMGQAS